MGSCLSKKGSTTTSTSSCTSATVVVSAPPPDPNKCGAQVEKKTVEAEEESVKKEIFVIKHRKSHDTRPEENGGVTCTSEAPQICNKTTTTTTTTITCSNNVVMNGGGGNSIDIVAAAAPVRTSSCTKEEVDAILIQCGRLSRSSSGKAASGSCGGRKYCGSKRSYDFDHRENDVDDRKKGNGIEDNDYDHNDDEMAEKRHHRQRHRHGQSRSSSHERRRTPSREREQQQRSGSRDRGSSVSGRRVSRSPGRRSETPPNTTTSGNGATPATASCNNNSTTTSTCRPGKMVSVPATVSSLMMDKSNNGGGGGVEPTTTAAIKRVSVKRNVGEAVVVGSRNAASPRSQSPANAKVSNENQNAHSHQQPSLSRNSSRKAERSPYRRNPLSEIDNNSVASQQLPQPPPSNKTGANNFVSQQAPTQNVEVTNNSIVIQGTNIKGCSSRGTQENKVVSVSCRAKEQIAEAPIEPKGGGLAVASGLKPQTLTRSRSSRRSRDLDHLINPETLLNPTASYTSLLLEDIQNFHQKKNANTSFSLPPCVTKACSILEAVADLNSCTSSINLSCAFSEDRNLASPFVESELVVGDDIMEPSLHKYVTVRRGTVGGGEMEEQESSGSNSFVGVGVSSSWEPNSADSTDCWTSSRSNTTREEDLTPLDRARRGFKRDSDHQRGGRVGASRGLQTLRTVAAAAST